MRSNVKREMVLFALLSLGSVCWAGSSRQDADERLGNATNVLHEVMGMPDKGIPEEVLERAKCVAVIPHMVKGGFVFGAKGGKGVASCRTAHGWSAPAFITISGGSWGLQIGVEEVDVVLIIQNEKGMQRLLESNFNIGADASAAAGPVGRHAEAGTDWKMDTEILTYSRAKGAFAGLTLEGASIRQDNDSRQAIYGPTVTTRALLLGKVAAPPSAHPFLAAISGAKAQAVAEGKAEGRPRARAGTKGQATLTGCLQKSADKGRFSLVAEDGKAWELHGNSIKLDNHLGHTVTVTGILTGEMKAQEKPRPGIVVQASSKEKEEYAGLSVTGLTIVSETCK